MDIQPSTKSKSKSRRKMREGRFSSSVTELTSSTTTIIKSATSSSSYARTVTKATTVNRSKSKAKSTTIFTNTNNQHRATMSTALCIVPPHHAWDVIQRARHMARDASFYRWPPAIRLFHPFVPHKDVPNAAGRLASWIDSVCEGKEGGEGDRDHESEEYDGYDNECADSSSSYLRPFEVTLDSILILPHWEILDARIEALEDSGGGAVGRNIGRRPRIRRDGGDSVTGRQRQQEQYTIHNNDYYHDTGDYYDSDENDDDAVANSGSQEMEYRRRKAEGARLIEDEERKGIARKKERERKRRMRLLGKDGGVDDDINTSNIVDEDSPSSSSSSSSSSSECGDNDLDEGDKPKNASSYNGPCVVYLSPDDASRHKLESLRERLRVELFPNYDAFSPGSSVSPYPECLPRPRSSSTGGSSSVGGGSDERGKISSPMSQFRPLLPIGRFSSVEDAVAVAKVLQSTWDPLTFNVTDIQFISRRVAHDNDYESLGGATTIAASNAGKSSVVMNSDAFSGGAGFGRSSSMKSLTTTTTTSVNRMAITTSGEVEDVSRQGIYGCDAMVMLVGEEPEEELMDIEASLALMMDDDDNDDDDDGDNNDGCIKDSEIDYDKIFAIAEREYRRMQSHEILSTMNPSPSTNSLDGDGQGDESDESTSDIEAWLDDDDESLEDEGATVVIGRAQFFMGANREFVG